MAQVDAWLRSGERSARPTSKVDGHRRAFVSCTLAPGGLVTLILGVRLSASRCHPSFAPHLVQSLCGAVQRWARGLAACRQRRRVGGRDGGSGLLYGGLVRPLLQGMLESLAFPSIVTLVVFGDAADWCLAGSAGLVAGGQGSCRLHRCPPPPSEAERAARLVCKHSKGCGPMLACAMWAVVSLAPCRARIGNHAPCLSGLKGLLALMTVVVMCRCGWHLGCAPDMPPRAFCGSWQALLRGAWALLLEVTLGGLALRHIVSGIEASRQSSLDCLSFGGQLLYVSWAGALGLST